MLINNFICLSVFKKQSIFMRMVPSLYELANKALDEAFRLRCEYLLSYSVDNIPTPVEQNGRGQKVLKRKFGQ